MRTVDHNSQRGKRKGGEGLQAKPRLEGGGWRMVKLERIMTESCTVQFITCQRRRVTIQIPMHHLLEGGMQSRVVVWMAVMLHGQQGRMEGLPTVGPGIYRRHIVLLAAMEATQLHGQLKPTAAQKILNDLRVQKVAEA